MHAMDDFKIRNDTQRDCEDDRKENCYVFFHFSWHCSNIA